MITRQAYSIIIQPGLWRGCDVEIAPPTSTHPMRHFDSRDEAMAYAEALSACEGWPIKDRCGG